MEILNIDLDKRKIVIPDSIEHLGVKDDDETRTLNFKMPRIYKGLDLGEFNIQVNYINAAKLGDSRFITEKTVDEDSISFSWSVGGTAYYEKGRVAFCIYLWKGNDEGIVVQKWHTTWAYLEVLDGGGIEEGMMPEHLDIIEQIYMMIQDINADIGAALAIAQEINGEEE